MLGGLSSDVCLKRSKSGGMKRPTKKVASCKFSNAGKRALSSQTLTSVLYLPEYYMAGMYFSKIDVRSRVQAHRSERSESFTEILQRPLPFKIPITNVLYVTAYPKHFEWGAGEYGSAVDTWIDGFKNCAASERTVTGRDLNWQKILQSVCDLTLMYDESSPSSKNLRPTCTALCREMLVLVAEAKCDIKDMSNTIKNLVSNFHSAPYQLLSADCPELPGIVTSMQGSAIHRIYYAVGTFQEERVHWYNFLSEKGRVEFICDIFKIALWIAGQTKPVKQFHLPPDVRMKTPNGHYVTLTRSGLLKEFEHKQDHTDAIAHIKNIYDAKLPNVEQGVTHHNSVTITTIGRRLIDAIYYHGLDKAAALAGATRALQQLHSIGMAHCDICVDNIFVDIETNVVFLGDLEYCRPIGDAPPDGILRSDPAARTAGELDELQLSKLSDELALL